MARLPPPTQSVTSHGRGDLFFFRSASIHRGRGLARGNRGSGKRVDNIRCQPRHEYSKMPYVQNELRTYAR
jgi:hypothetical protein